MDRVWLSSTYYLDPAVAGLSADAERVFTRGLAYCGAANSRGFIAENVLLGLGNKRGNRPVLELVKAGLWEIADGGYRVRSWAEWQKNSEEYLDRKASDRERQKRRRERIKAELQASVSRDMSRDIGTAENGHPRKSVAVPEDFANISDREIVPKSSRKVAETDPHVITETMPDQGERAEMTENMSRDNSRDVTHIDIDIEKERGSYVPEVSHERARTEPEPTPNCPDHPNGTTRPCAACGAARRMRDEWRDAQRRAAAYEISTNARTRAEARLAEIAACSLCDEDGYDRGALCAHDPNLGERAQRGVAEFQALMAAKRAAKAELTPKPAQTAAGATK